MLQIATSLIHSQKVILNSRRSQRDTETISDTSAEEQTAKNLKKEPFKSIFQKCTDGYADRLDHGW